MRRKAKRRAATVVRIEELERELFPEDFRLYHVCLGGGRYICFRDKAAAWRAAQQHNATIAVIDTTRTGT